MDSKKQVIDALSAALLEKIREFGKQVEILTGSRNEETKSSAGDKYETGRAMAQMEIDQVQTQLDIYEQQIKMYISLNASSKFVSIAPGAIFEASNGKFLMGIPFGKLEVGEKIYHCISADSPFGKACMLKRENETFTFMQKEITILWIQ